MEGYDGVKDLAGGSKRRVFSLGLNERGEI